MHPGSTPAEARQASDASARLPQPPSERELAILRRVLGAVQVDGVEHLVDQLRMLQVAPGSEPTCRIYLVHGDAPRSGFAREGRDRLPVCFPVRTPQDRVIGEIMLWVDHGHLRALQFVRHDSQAALTLPDPEWIEVAPREVPASVRGHGAMQALAGVRAFGDEPVRRPPVAQAAASPRHRHRGVVVTSLALSILLLAAAAFLTARSGGVDLDLARQAGAAEGSATGAKHGEIAGRFAGSIEGRLAGRDSTYRAAYDSARTRALAVARRDALRRRRAAEARAAEARAAAAAPAPAAYPNPSTCYGYRDSSGNWICT